VSDLDQCDYADWQRIKVRLPNITKPWTATQRRPTWTEEEKMRVYKLCLGLALTLSLLLSSQAGSAATVSPGALVKDLGDRVLAIFNDPKLPFPEREQRMHAIAVKEFDVPYSARFVLGPYWRGATEQERQDFTKAYEDYIVHVYAGEFNLHHDAELKVVGERAEGPKRVLVQSKILRRDGQPPLQVDWRMMESGETYKIIDVSITGISQLVALREQFSAIIAREGGGVPMLTKYLLEKSRA
jgi:phospholipid transport system substrate-binding protein